MLTIIKENWAIIWALGSTIISVGFLFLSKTYAKKDEFNELKSEVEQIRHKINELPSTRDLHQLQLDIAHLRGELREIAPQMRQVKHMTDLWLQHELRDKK